MSHITEGCALIEESLCDSIFSDLTSDIEREISHRARYAISCEEYEKYIGHFLLDIADITLIIDDPLGFLHGDILVKK